MCGRFALFATRNEMMAHFHIKGGFVMKPRYNIAPTQTIPILLSFGEDIEFCRWGFIAPWAKAQEPMPPGHINARSETVMEKPTFKEAIQKRRCLIPASGYYEWKTYSKKKQPYYIFVKNEPLIAFAGIWSMWKSPQGEQIKTCAIITQNAGDELLAIHERMPVIISKNAYKNWLAKDYDFTNLAEALVPITKENIGIKPVSAKMNNPHFEGIECIRSIS